MRLLAITIVVSLLLACTPKEGTLTGEVSIVTSGGQHTKLGGVTVTAISEELISTFLEDRKKAAAIEAQRLERNLQEAHSRVESAKAALQVAEARHDKAAKAVQSGGFLMAVTCTAQGLGNILTNMDPDKYPPERPDPVCRRLFEAVDEVEKRKELLKRRQAEASEAEAVGGFTESSAFYFDGLADLLANSTNNAEGQPSVLSIAITNADGRFSMTLPRQGRFALLTTNLGLVSAAEARFWLVWVSLDGAAEKHIMLTDDNMTTSGSPDSIIASLKTVQLTGEVFIVTRGGDNVKLGLVRVLAIPEQDVSSFVETRKAQLDARRQQLERDKIASEQSDKVAAASLSTVDTRVQEAYYKCLSSSLSRGECMQQKEQHLKNPMTLLQQSSAAAAKIERQLSALNTSEVFFSEPLPEGSGSAKTNADGRFSMELPTDERYALAASVTREISGKTEKYYWLVWVPVNGQNKAHIMLTNDNLTTSGSPESVITLPR